MLAASALRAYAPLRACPHFVSECVRYARGTFIALASPTAVRGYALALPCACAHSNTPAQLQKTNIKNNGKQKTFAFKSASREFF